MYRKVFKGFHEILGNSTSQLFTQLSAASSGGMAVVWFLSCHILAQA